MLSPPHSVVRVAEGDHVVTIGQLDVHGVRRHVLTHPRVLLSVVISEHLPGAEGNTTVGTLAVNQPEPAASARRDLQRDRSLITSIADDHGQWRAVLDRGTFALDDQATSAVTRTR